MVLHFATLCCMVQRGYVRVSVQLPVGLYGVLVREARLGCRSLSSEVVVRLGGVVTEGGEPGQGGDRLPQSEPVGRVTGESEGTGRVREGVSPSRAGPPSVTSSRVGVCVHRVPVGSWCKRCDG